MINEISTTSDLPSRESATIKDCPPSTRATLTVKSPCTSRAFGSIDPPKPNPSAPSLLSPWNIIGLALPGLDKGIVKIHVHEFLKKFQQKKRTPHFFWQILNANARIISPREYVCDVQNCTVNHALTLRHKRAVWNCRYKFFVNN